jgi:hypothetical protein
MGVPNRFFLLGVQGQGGLMKIPGEVSSGFYWNFSLPRVPRLHDECGSLGASPLSSHFQLRGLGLQG